MINEKMSLLGAEPSKIRELFEESKKLKEKVGEDNVFDFTIGNPSLDAPKEVKDELIKLINEERSISIHGYSSSNGYPKTREAITLDLNKRFDEHLDYNLMYLTSGAAAALTITFKSLIESNDDEIITFIPFFPEYRVFVGEMGGKLVPIETNDELLPDIDILRNSINKNTKAVLINSPNNPTGVFYDHDVIKSIAEILTEKEKELNKTIYLISDEPYRELLYVDKKYPFITKYYDNSIVIYSYSKSLSLPGERIGYVLVSPKAKDAHELYNAILGSGRSLGYICAPTLMQKLIPNILDAKVDISLYKKNRDEFYKIFDELGYEYIKGDGAFYIFLKSLTKDSNEMAQIAKRFNLFFVPSDSFGKEGYERVSYCVNYETIKKSYDAFKKLKEYIEANYDKVK